MDFDVLVLAELLIRYSEYVKNGEKIGVCQLFEDFKEAYDSVGREISMKLVRPTEICLNTIYSKV
jgi:hypothetical protein